MMEFQCSIEKHCTLHGLYFGTQCPSWWWPQYTVPPWPQPPPLCTGTGTLDVDYFPNISGTKGDGVCGICGQRVRLNNGQYMVAHAYRLKTDPEYLKAEFS